MKQGVTLNGQHDWPAACSPLMSCVAYVPCYRRPTMY